MFEVWDLMRSMGTCTFNFKQQPQTRHMLSSLSYITVSPSLVRTLNVFLIRKAMMCFTLSHQFGETLWGQVRQTFALLFESVSFTGKPPAPSQSFRMAAPRASLFMVLKMFIRERRMFRTRMRPGLDEVLQNSCWIHNTN